MQSALQVLRQLTEDVFLADLPTEPGCRRAQASLLALAHAAWEDRWVRCDEGSGFCQCPVL